MGYGVAELLVNGRTALFLSGVVSSVYHELCVEGIGDSFSDVLVHYWKGAAEELEGDAGLSLAVCVLLITHRIHEIMCDSHLDQSLS